MATRPYSKLKGDPWRAYDELPTEVRLALQESLVDWCPLRAREWHVQLLRERRLRPAQASHLLVQTIRRYDQAEVAAFAGTWPKGRDSYPHLAAGATLQRYVGREGIPAAEPVAVPAMPKRSEVPAKPNKAPATRSKLRARPAKAAAKRTAKVPAKRKAGRRARR